jgi:hypothetical protein
MGVLLNNQWSIGGDPLRPAVNTFLAQPFINYKAHGWLFDLIAAHHRELAGCAGSAAGRASCRRRWPNIQTRQPTGERPAYYNAINPTGAPNWQLRGELSFLFPERHVKKSPSHRGEETVKRLVNPNRR